MRINELNCFTKIKESYFKHIGAKKEFDNSDYLTMASIFNGTHQNEKQNEFPDFLFDDGAIEHFEVTASKETRKGSKYTIDDIKKNKDTEQYFDELDKEFLKSNYHPGELITASREDVHKCFSYDAFTKSFKRNTSKHLVSLRKSSYCEKIVIFLIEQQGARLCVYRNNIFDKFYQLSDDKNLLIYIKDNMSDVNYIIFTAADAYEILDLSKIDTLISNAKENQDIRGGTRRNVSLKLYNDI